MIRRLWLLVVMARPPVLVLLGMFCAVGLAQAGHGEDRVSLAKALAVVAGFLLFSVACNDLADEAIDRVNLPGDLRRPLASGTAGRRETVTIGVTAGLVALAVSATLFWPALVVTAAGLALSAGYSLRPVRIADRGAVASLLLPACYVAVPYLVGIFAVRDSAGAGDLALLGGLYVGFIGRILLKDFRDVRGDALFGKRTFLVRHGRRSTCVFSAWCWGVGSVVLVAGVQRPTPVLAVCIAGYLAMALGLLRALARDEGARRDESLIAAIAIVGRAMVLTMLLHLSMANARMPLPVYVAVLVTLLTITAGQAAAMVRRGPITTLTVPAEWLRKGRVPGSGGALPGTRSSCAKGQ